MSRIYDALQRADLERKTAREAEVNEHGEPFAADSKELPQAETEAILDNIARQPWGLSISSLPALGDSGESVEQFRSLRSHIYQFRDEVPLKTVVICSGMPAEGKTFVASNLAMSLARNKNDRVLLIDGDLRSPAVHDLLGAPNAPGLTEYLAGAAELHDILQRNRNLAIAEAGRVLNIPDIAFIPAGKGGDSASELVASYRFEELVKTLSPNFDWILIDSPPVLAFADAIELARAADAVLLVARGASTPFDVAQRAQAAFSNSRILGFVLNAVKDPPGNRSYYGYYASK